MSALFSATGLCRGLFTLVLGTQAPYDFQLVQFQTERPERTVQVLERLRIAPQPESLVGPTETDNLFRWLQRIFPPQAVRCDSHPCPVEVSREVWYEDRGSCKVQLTYLSGPSTKPVFDIFLRTFGNVNRPNSAFRATMVLDDPRKSVPLLPDLAAEWSDFTSDLESKAQVEPTRVTLTSRPMIQGMTLDHFYDVGLHELRIEFGPQGDPIGVTGTHLPTGESAVCNFADGT